MPAKVEPIGLREIEERLHRFEEGFGMPSARFVMAFRNGQLEETDEFREWSTLYSAWLAAMGQKRSPLPPGYIRSLEDYWVWAERLIHQSGGWFENDDFLRVRPIEDLLDPDAWVGLMIEHQRVRFHDGSFLELFLVVDSDLLSVEYHFHHQAEDGWLIWRKDKHPGHEAALGQIEHIHRKP